LAYKKLEAKVFPWKWYGELGLTLNDVWKNRLVRQKSKIIVVTVTVFV